MIAFEFLFTFLSLILGLAVAQVASGLGNALAMRRQYSIGYLTPLLSLFLLLDISSFWIWAWLVREAVPFNYATVNIGLLLALAYFVATVLLYPPASEAEDLDRNYWANKRLIVGIVIGVNLAVLLQGVIDDPSVLTSANFLLYQPPYWAALLILIFSRSARIDIGALLVASFVYELAAVRAFLQGGTIG